MFDLVLSASSIHGAYWMEGAGGIFCENEAMRWLVSLTGLPDGALSECLPAEVQRPIYRPQWLHAKLGVLKILPIHTKKDC